MKKCPYCGYENNFDDKYCPNCGKAVYKCHNCQTEIKEKVDSCPNCHAEIKNYDLETTPRGLYKEKLNRLNAKFNQISTIITLVLLSLSLVICLGKYLDFTSFGEYNPLKGSTYYYLIGSFIDFFLKGVNSYNDGVELGYIIFKALLVLSNVIIVFIFSIKGIRKCVNDLKDKTSTSRTYFFAIYLSMFIVTKLLTIFDEATSTDAISINASITSFLSISTLLIAFEIFTTVFTSYRRHEVSSLIEKAIYGTIFLTVVLLILGINKPAIVIDDVSYTPEALQHYYLLNILTSSSISDKNIATFIALTTVSSLQIVELIALCVLSQFFVSSFFSKEDNFKLKMTTYVLSLFELITSLVQFISLFALLIILSIENSSSLIYLGPYHFTNFIFSLILFSLSVYSFVVSRNKRAKTKGTSETCPHNN